MFLWYDLVHHYLHCQGVYDFICIRGDSVMKNKINMPEAIKKYLFTRFRRNAVFASIFLLCTISTILFVPSSTDWMLPTSASWVEIALVHAEDTITRLIFVIVLIAFSIPFLIFSSRTILLLQNLKCVPFSKTYRVLSQYGNPSLLLRDLDNKLDMKEKRSLKQHLRNKKIYVNEHLVVAPYSTYVCIIPMTHEPSISP